MIAVIMDTETTNLLLPSIAPLASQPRIIEFGAMKVDSETQTVLGEVSQLLYPGFLISDEITKITKITREDLDGKPVFKSFVPTLIEFFTGVDLLVAHNLGFDADMLANELKLAGCTDFPWPKERFCTVQEYTPIVGHRPHLPTLYKLIIGEELAQTHRALDDVRAVWAILQKDNALSLFQ